MESTQEVSKKVGQAVLTPIPELDLLKSSTSAVGHAGIYEPDDEDIDIDAADVEAEVVNVLKLGANGIKFMLSVEEGVKTLVDELAKDKENHLPNSRVGVYVHYLVKGVKEDFNTEFDKTPESISKKGSNRTLKAKKDKIPFLSKKDKNELLAKLTYQYYENDVNNGVITQAEAFGMMSEEAARKKMFEDKGLFISSNKTQGVTDFDWKSIIQSTHNSTYATRVYTTNKIQILIPNILENFFSADKLSSKYGKELLKSPLYKVEDVSKAGGGSMSKLDNIKIKTNEDIIDYLKREQRFEKGLKQLEGAHKITGIHLTKMLNSGGMKPRQICIETISKDQKSIEVFMFMDYDGVCGVMSYEYSL